MVYFSTFFVSLFITLVLIPILTKLALRKHIVDEPGPRKVHTLPMPKLGGLAIATGTLFPIIIWTDFVAEIKGLVSGLVIIVVLGLLDDFYELRYREKFIGQFVATFVAIFLSRIYVTQLGSLGELNLILPLWIALPLTVMFIVGATNAINLADGLDGLAAGISLLSFGCIAYLAYISGEMPIFISSLAIIGAILGFLRFNTYPATIFMGDTGSQFLGFSAGWLSLALTQKETNPLSHVLPVIILGFPILDTLAVMLERFSQGRPIFIADKNHFHHKLLRIGFNHKEAVIIIYFLQCLLITFALIFRYYPEGFLFGGYLLFCLIVLCFFYIAERTHWVLRRSVNMDKDLAFATLSSSTKDKINKGVFKIISFIIPILLLFLSLIPRQIPKDMGIISLLLLTIILVVYTTKREVWPRFFIRLNLYIAGIFLIYLANKEKIIWFQINMYYLQIIIFSLLMVLIAIYVKFSEPEYFQMTPLDYLIIFMIFIILLISHLPRKQIAMDNLSIFLAETMVFFWGVELILSHKFGKWNALSISTLIVLFITGIRGLF